MSSVKHFSCSPLNKLINIIDNKLILINDLNFSKKEIFIISFLGPARIGKSTLINCFISFLLNKNNKIFQTSSSVKEHCTRGIDMVYLESETNIILLLDVQGLDFEDSSNDCKLMLFVYMISNLIIYNERGILTNKVLSSLQSLTSLLTFMEQNKEFNKPELIFRTGEIDPDSDFESKENLDKMLIDSINIDQYSNTRKSINKLFSNITSIPTYRLDRSETKILNNENDYLKFISLDNGFINFCSIIFHIVTTKQNNFTNINDIKTILTQINDNTNIDFTKFDLTSNQAIIAIREWEETSIDISKFNKIIVDGTQKNYDKCIQSIIDYRDDILKQYNSKFELTTPDIKIEHENRIRSKFDNVIDEAINESITLSENIIRPIIEPKQIIKPTQILLDISDSDSDSDSVSDSKYYKILSLDNSYDDNAKILHQGFLKIKKIITNKQCLLQTQEKYCNILDNLEKNLNKQIESWYNQYINDEMNRISEKIEILRLFIIQSCNELMENTKLINISFERLIKDIEDKLITDQIEKMIFYYPIIECNLIEGTLI
jgi:energy-coupling factor transporter ATP-binding protein EcfA2